MYKELTAAEIGAALEKFFDKPERWTDGAFAMDANGIPVGPHNADATCYCLIGAVYCMWGDSALDNRSRYTWGKRARDARKAITGFLPEGESVETWNDAKGRTFADVQELLKRMQSAT